MEHEASHSDSPADSTDGWDVAALTYHELKDVDVALSLVTNLQDDPPISPMESKRLCRKIDWHILPLLCLVYTCTFSAYRGLWIVVDSFRSAIYRQVSLLSHSVFFAPSISARVGAHSLVHPFWV